MNEIAPIEMVYRGKPSEGCQTCRERKIRCDRAPDGCNNCARVKRTCPGYRDQSELIYVHESEHVKRRATRPKAAAKSKKGAAPQSLSPVDSREQSRRQSRQDSPTEETGLPVDLDQRAMDYFLKYHALNGVADKWPSPHRRSESASTGLRALHSAIQAIGIAGLARSENNPDLLTEANKRYLRAVRLTNSALREPEEAKRNSTLVAIMLLSIFETITGYNRASIKTWSQHVHGAGALLSLRGPEQFQTPEGLRLFAQASTSVMVSCMQQGINLPDQIPELTVEGAKYVDPNDPLWQLFEIEVTLTNFLGHVKQKTLSNPHEILATAFSLESSLSMLLSDRGTAWNYRVIYSDEDPELVLLGYYHFYDQYYKSMTWMAVWTLRIVLNQLIRSILLLGFTSRPPIFYRQEDSESFQAVTDKLYELQNDIIASVPQYMGKMPPDTSRSPKKPEEQFLWTAFTQLEPYNMTHTDYDESREVPMIRSLGGYFLPWCLSLLGDSDIATPQIRSWVARMLGDIARTRAAQQAAVLAERLEDEDRARPWFRDRSVLQEESQRLLAQSMGVNKGKGRIIGVND